MTWTTGEATIRHVLIMQLDLAANVGSQIGVVSDQYAKLRGGLPVVVTREQLQQFSHSAFPADLAAHPLWLLTGDSTLAVAP